MLKNRHFCSNTHRPLHPLFPPSASYPPLHTLQSKPAASGGKGQRSEVTPEHMGYFALKKRRIRVFRNDMHTCMYVVCRRSQLLRVCVDSSERMSCVSVGWSVCLCVCVCVIVWKQCVSGQTKWRCTVLMCPVNMKSKKKQPWCRSPSASFFGIHAYQHSPRRKPLTPQFSNTLEQNARRNTCLSLCSVSVYRGNLTMFAFLFFFFFFVIHHKSKLLDEQ